MTIEAASILGVGLYTISDAGRLSRTPRKTVDRWVHLGGRPQALYQAPGQVHLLTFEDLISLLTVRELRKSGVDVETIKDAEQNLAQVWGVEKPFAHGLFRTGYGAIITVIAERERPVAVAKAIQEVLYELIEQELCDVSYDAAQRASRWQPAAHVTLQPDLQFGQPCIEGSRVTTRTVYQFIGGGESFDELSADLDIPVEKLRAAYEYEESLWRRPS